MRLSIVPVFCLVYAYLCLVHAGPLRLFLSIWRETQASLCVSLAEDGVLAGASPLRFHENIIRL